MHRSILKGDELRNQKSAIPSTYEESNTKWKAATILGTCNCIPPSTTVWGVNLFQRFCNMYSESSPGHWAVLQLPRCPSKEGELSENILQNLLNKWPPQTVSPSPALPPDRRAVGEELVVEEEVRGVNGGEGDDEVGHLAPEEDEGVHVELVVHMLLEAIV